MSKHKGNQSNGEMQERQQKDSQEAEEKSESSSTKPRARLFYLTDKGKGVVYGDIVEKGDAWVSIEPVDKDVYLMQIPREHVISIEYLVSVNRRANFEGEF